MDVPIIIRLRPSKYLLDCFDADYDKRWEVTFTTAFVQFSAVQSGGSYLFTKKQTLDDGTTPKIEQNMV